MCLQLFALLVVYFFIQFLVFLMSFCLTLQDSLEHFLQGRSTGNELSQLLFIWEYVSSSALEGAVCWIARILGWELFALIFSMYQPTAFCQSFWWETYWLSYWDNHFMWWVASLLLPSNSLYLIIIYLCGFLWVHLTWSSLNSFSVLNSCL